MQPQQIWSFRHAVVLAKSPSSSHTILPKASRAFCTNHPSSMLGLTLSPRYYCTLSADMKSWTINARPHSTCTLSRILGSGR